MTIAGRALRSARRGLCARVHQSCRDSIRELLTSWLDNLGPAAARHESRSFYTAPAVPDQEFFHQCRQAIRWLRRRGAEWPIGDYLQFGVGGGVSMACMYHALEAEGLRHVRLFGFENLEGNAERDEADHRETNRSRAEREGGERYLRMAGVNWTRITLIKGAFGETLTSETKDRLRIEGASLIVVQCDTYRTTCEALWFSELLIRDQAVLFLQYGSCPEASGQALAFDEFRAAHPQLSVEQLPVHSARGQVLLVSRTSSS